MSTQYLQFFPKPLLDDFLAGRWLPVVGAGMSLNAIAPRGQSLPLWPDLGKSLAEPLSNYSSNSALDSISAFQHEFGRARLIERLAELLFVREAQPGEAHRAFCSIAFDIVCTTNFDFLLERQYELVRRHAYPVIEEEQLSINGSAAGTLLLKLHGDLHHPSRLVVTEDDYDGFLTRYPIIATYLANLLITKTALLIGYSLDDPDFRQIWKVVSARLGPTRRPAYALMVGAQPSDVARFERRGVKVINLPGSAKKYGQILAAAFDELCNFQREQLFSVSQVTKEAPLAELTLPRDATSRLCFFSIPVELLSWYRTYAFPLAEQAGFVPVTAEDVISPGDNINAKIVALIERASAIVVDLSSEWTRAELDLAVAQSRKMADVDSRERPEVQIIVVRSTKGPRRGSEGFARIVDRPQRLIGEAGHFLAALAEHLHQIANSMGIARLNEPQRLFQAREYRAAVVSAMGVLEAWLRSALQKREWTSVQKPASLKALVELGIEKQVIQIEWRQKVFEWIWLRNQAAHTGKSITATEARNVVDGVRSIVGQVAY